nr:hypothetical protein [uncultured bacterium]
MTGADFRADVRQPDLHLSTEALPLQVYFFAHDEIPLFPIYKLTA